ncbi:endospore germination permease [Paenibacillus pasadenensis]|uniref:GerAB/ArcD/ProY family transporter n=1 Tax=Paenibacillus pasadenensis TaxID=217090 RepID=UPI002040D08A|nr:endospore germination permease [Paenibacillus pasadenensis]MCM3748894.1 endospore germination permease [Paenibacillus pasadenensis]
MLNNGKIGAYPFMVLVTMFIVGDALLYVPAWLASAAKQDAWIAALLCMAEGALLAILYNAVAKRFYPATIVEMSGIAFGKWAGAAVALFFIIFIVIDISFLLMETGDFVTTQMMPDMPVEVILILFSGIAVSAARRGVQTMSRSAESLFPWFVALYVIFVLFISPQIKLSRIEPVFHAGFIPVLHGSFKYLGNMEEVVILLMLFPFVKLPERGTKALFLGVLLGNFILSAFTAITILVMGSTLTTMFSYPSYALAQKISIGDFFQRIEAIMAFMWFITVFIKIAVCYFAASFGIAQLLKLPDYRIVTLPLGMITIVLGLQLVPNRPYFNQFASLFWTPYTLTFGQLLPLLLLGVALLRKSVGKEERV